MAGCWVIATTGIQSNIGFSPSYAPFSRCLSPALSGVFLLEHGMLVIKNWSETFENSDSRKRQRLGWFLTPSGCESGGYIELMSYGEPGVLAFGVFQAICQWSATNRQTIRGKLARSDGSALNVRQIAAFIRIPEQTVQNALDLLCSKHGGWIVDLTNENTASAEICHLLPLICHMAPSNLLDLLKEKEKEKEKEKFPASRWASPIDSIQENCHSRKRSTPKSFAKCGSGGPNTDQRRNPRSRKPPATANCGSSEKSGLKLRLRCSISPLRTATRESLN